MKVWPPRASASNCDRLATAHGGRRSADQRRKRGGGGGVEGGESVEEEFQVRVHVPGTLVGMQPWKFF